jgi:hypothetical protein
LLDRRVVAALLVRVRFTFLVVAGFVFFVPRVLPALTRSPLRSRTLREANR